MDYSALYTELGRLAYAIARADGIIHSKEIDLVCDFIGQEIEKTGAEDHHKREAVLQAGVEFNNLRKNNASAKEAFTGFTGFIETNPSLFDARIRNLCINISLRIASAYEGMDETELALINKLKKKLDSIN